MKNFLCSLACCLLAFSFSDLHSQSAPQWFKDINAFPDSSSVLPVRIVNDQAGNVYVLSAYVKGSGPGANHKIYLYKNNPAGTPIWNLKFDNGGNGQPHGYDMAIDTSGNVYIAGGLMGFPGAKPFVMKVNLSGSVQWQRDTTAVADSGYFTKITLFQDKLYLSGTTCIAKFDLNGNEAWSDTASVHAMVVDPFGQLIYADSTAGSLNIFRCDSNGIQNFSDSTILAKRIAADDAGSFYLLADTPAYSLVKYDSAGVFTWRYDSFPAISAPIDAGMALLCDFNNDVIVIGLSDTMFKFTPAGNLLWTRGLNGLDHPGLTATVTSNNLLAVATSVAGGNGFDMYVSWFDLQGIQNWAGHYSSNDSLKERTQDMSIHSTGVYVLENYDNRTTFVKFESPFTSTIIDYSKVCIDSVWYPTGIINYYNVRVYNGNIVALNYPSVRMVDQFLDTIGNPDNVVTFFTHPGNSYQTYYDTIKVPFISNFTPYVFLVCENYGDTMTIVEWCTIAGLNELIEPKLLLFPNPVENILRIGNPPAGRKLTVEIFSATGSCVYRSVIKDDPEPEIDVSLFDPGIYFIRMHDGSAVRQGKFIRQW